VIKSVKAEIVENKPIAPEFFRMTLKAETLASEGLPGQFVMVKVSPNLEPFLRRPISLHQINREEATVSLLYQVVGKGTRLMSETQKGKVIELLGPLGKGFTWSDSDRVVALVGGGCGTAPLVALAHSLLEDKKEVHVLLGAQTKEKLVCEEDFISMGAKVKVATDDGSYGHHGFVTDLLKNLMHDVALDMVYSCGPLPMTKEVVKLTQEASIPCQVSLEERMGCGIGACIGCVCKVRTKDGAFTYKKVCKDGPVFKGEEVMFDD